MESKVEEGHQEVQVSWGPVGPWASLVLRARWEVLGDRASLVGTEIPEREVLMGRSLGLPLEPPETQASPASRGLKASVENRDLKDSQALVACQA